MKWLTDWSDFHYKWYIPQILLNAISIHKHFILEYPVIFINMTSQYGMIGNACAMQLSEVNQQVDL